MFGTLIETHCVSDLSALKTALRAHCRLDAMVAEYNGESATPLRALEIAYQTHPVPRRIMLTHRSVTEGVADALQDGRATSLAYLPCFGDQLLKQINAPVPIGRLTPPRAA